MKKEQTKAKPILSLKQSVHEFPQRFPLNYSTLDEECVSGQDADTSFFDAYAQCSAYRSKGYFVFMHHFPISKPGPSHEQ